MPRRIEVVVPVGEADALVERIERVKGVTGVSVSAQGSRVPAGDVVTIIVSNDASRSVLRTLAETKAHEAGSIQVSELTALVASGHADELSVEGSEQNLEETGTFLRREVNPTPNFFALMALSGGMAAIGLWTDTLHLVIGAMIVAPGFEPILRVPFGMLAGPRGHVRLGAIGTVGGYATLALGAAVVLLLLRALDPAAPTDLSERFWVRYWTTLTPAGVVMALVAGAAGIVTVMAERPVLTAGVMVALALVPAMTIVGLAVASLDLGLATQALGRWAVDAVGVLVATTLVVWLKKRVLHKRNAIG